MTLLCAFVSCGSPLSPECQVVAKRGLLRCTKRKGSQHVSEAKAQLPLHPWPSGVYGLLLIGDKVSKWSPPPQKKMTGYFGAYPDELVCVGCDQNCHQLCVHP